MILKRQEHAYSYKIMLKGWLNFIDKKQEDFEMLFAILLPSSGLSVTLKSMRFC